MQTAYQVVLGDGELGLLLGGGVAGHVGIVIVVIIVVIVVVVVLRSKTINKCFLIKQDGKPIILTCSSAIQSFPSPKVT